MMMNMHSSAPTTIFVHHAESVPWNVMNVRIIPWINTPKIVPGINATPPVKSVPPITEEAMASISMPMA